MKKRRVGWVAHTKNETKQNAQTPPDKKLINHESQPEVSPKSKANPQRYSILNSSRTVKGDPISTHTTWRHQGIISGFLHGNSDKDVSHSDSETRDETRFWSSTVAHGQQYA